MSRRAAALCLALLPLLATQARAAENDMHVTGSGSQQALACDGQDVDITGRGHRVTLRGRCGAVLVAGRGHVVMLERAARLEVTGAENSVAASGTLGALAVYGRDQRVKAATAAEPATAELHGEGSLVELTLNGPSQVLITGIGNRLLWTAAAGVPEPVGDVGGRGSRLERAR